MPIFTPQVTGGMPDYRLEQLELQRQAQQQRAAQSAAQMRAQARQASTSTDLGERQLAFQREKFAATHPMMSQAQAHSQRMAEEGLGLQRRQADVPIEIARVTQEGAGARQTESLGAAALRQTSGQTHAEEMAGQAQTHAEGMLDRNLESREGMHSADLTQRNTEHEAAVNAAKKAHEAQQLSAERMLKMQLMDKHKILVKDRLTGEESFQTSPEFAALEKLNLENQMQAAIMDKFVKSLEMTQGLREKGIGTETLEEYQKHSGLEVPPQLLAAMRTIPENRQAQFARDAQEIAPAVESVEGFFQPMVGELELLTSAVLGHEGRKGGKWFQSDPLGEGGSFIGEGYLLERRRAVEGWRKFDGVGKAWVDRLSRIGLDRKKLETAVVLATGPQSALADVARASEEGVLDRWGIGETTDIFKRGGSSHKVLSEMRQRLMQMILQYE